MKKITLFSLIFLVFFACRKDIDQQVTSIDPHNPDIINLDDPKIDPIPVTGTLAGRVYDEDNQPIVDALVTIKNYSTTTDERGLFVFKQIPMDAAGTFVLVKKDGYFNGSNRFFPQDGSQNYSNIKLLTKTHIGSFNSNAGGEVSSQEGIKIDFPANSIVDASGQTYGGNVNVAAREIDPSADDLAEIMPGDMQGFNRLNEEVALASYGMMAVKLTDDLGQELNLGNGKKAELTFPVPFELQDNAPEEIPLWYFNEDFGLWQEEGSAILQGNNYVGEVAHFSFWNCDAPFPLIHISGIIVNQNGNPIPNASVCFYFPSWQPGRCGATDNDGYFAGKIPANEELILTLGQFDDCFSYYSENVGPFDVDTDLGYISVEVSGMVEIIGSVVDCAGDQLNDGWVYLGFGYYSSYYYMENSNEINVSYLNCNDIEEVKIRAINLADNEESGMLIYPITEPVTDLGEIEACGIALDEFITVEIDGDSKTFVLPSAGDSLDMTVINAYEPGAINESFHFETTVTSPGNYDGSVVLGLYIYVDFPSNGILSIGCDMIECGITEVIITEYGLVGEKIKGSFSGVGDFLNEQQQIVSLSYSAEFEIIRDF